MYLNLRELIRNNFLMQMVLKINKTIMVGIRTIEKYLNQINQILMEGIL